MPDKIPPGIDEWAAEGRRHGYWSYFIGPLIGCGAVLVPMGDDGDDIECGKKYFHEGADWEVTDYCGRCEQLRKLIGDV